MINEVGSVSKERIFDTMLAFVDAPGVDEIVTRLVGRGWAEQSEISKQGTVEFQLTEECRRRHGVILAKQEEVRRRAMHGISEEEYATVSRVLKRIVSNLEGHIIVKTVRHSLRSQPVNLFQKIILSSNWKHT